MQTIHQAFCVMAIFPSSSETAQGNAVTLLSDAAKARLSKLSLPSLKMMSLGGFQFRTPLNHLFYENDDILKVHIFNYLNS